MDSRVQLRGFRAATEPMILAEAGVSSPESVFGGRFKATRVVCQLLLLVFLMKR